MCASSRREVLLSLCIIFLEIIEFYTILKIAKSSESTVMKVVWIVIVLVLPVLGLIAWFFAGPGDKALKL
jgi:hypothetical protein